jgi:hypothetical protein
MGVVMVVGASCSISEVVVIMNRRIKKQKQRCTYYVVVSAEARMNFCAGFAPTIVSNQSGSGFIIMVLRTPYMILRAGGHFIAPSAMQADVGCIDIVHLGGTVQLTTHGCISDRRTMCALDMTKTSTQDRLGRSALEKSYLVESNNNNNNNGTALEIPLQNFVATRPSMYVVGCVVNFVDLIKMSALPHNFFAMQCPPLSNPEQRQ